MVEIKPPIRRIKKDMLEKKKESMFYYFALISLTAVFLILTLGGGADFTGTFGRVAGFFILLLIGYTLIERGENITEKHELWEEKEKLDEEINLRMYNTSKTLQRASEGETTSQKKMAEKIKKAFLIKLREERGLSEEEMQELLKDEDKFRTMVEDDLISDFILTEVNDEGGEKKKVTSFLLSSEETEEAENTEKIEKYRKKIDLIIRRIEQWD